MPKMNWAVAVLAIAGTITAVIGGPPALALSGSEWKVEVAWFLSALILVLPPLSKRLSNSWDYLIVIGMVAGPLALATLYHQLSVAAALRCTHCIAVSGCAAGIVAIALMSPRTSTSLSARMFADFRVMRRLSGLSLIAAAFVFSWTAMVAGESLRIQKWLSSTDKVEALKQTGHVSHVAIFSDYQCPACAAKHKSYDAVIADIVRSSNGKVVLDRFDYPLDTECNSEITALVHPAACEAAVLARIAREKGKETDVADYLYGHHADLTAELVRTYAGQLGFAAEYESRYSELIGEIRKDIELGARAGIQGTPTYFVNGILLENSTTPAMLAAIIRAASGS